MNGYMTLSRARDARVARDLVSHCARAPVSRGFWVLAPALVGPPPPGAYPPRARRPSPDVYSRCLTPLPPSHTDLRSRIRITVSARLDRDTRADAPRPAAARAARVEAAIRGASTLSVRAAAISAASPRAPIHFMETDRGFGNGIDAPTVRWTLQLRRTRSTST